MKLFFPLFFLPAILISCKGKLPANQGTAEPKAPTIGANIFRLSDISFPDQQYSINFRLYIDYKNPSPGSPKIDFINQISIPDSKRKPEITQVYLTYDSVANENNLALDVNCLMDKSWDVSGYPFDDQDLPVDIYIPGFDSGQLKFHIDTNRVSFPNTVEFDGTWLPNINRTSKNVYYKVMNEDKSKMCSIFNFTIPIHRENPFFIFWKLFAGMYIAFLVSFVALFVNIKHEDPRFGLPVGGLFATVANKYIIEGFLPLTSKLTLVDWLHDITIFFIFLVIAFSVVSLKLSDLKEIPQPALQIGQRKGTVTWKRYLINRIAAIKPLNFLALYLAINLVMILIAACH